MLLKGIFLAFCCIALFMLAQHIALRTPLAKWPDQSPIRKLSAQFRLFFIVWLGFLLLYIVLFRLMPGEGFALFDKWPRLSSAVDFIHGIVVYFVIFFSYLSFYYIVDRSVSTRIMIEIENSPSKQLSLNELKDIYDVEDKYLRELKGMLEGKFIIKDSGYYRNTLKGSWHARISRFLKGYMRLGAGG